MPLLMRFPALVPPGSVVNPMALNLDIGPTMLELAGLPTPPTMHGRSLLPLLVGDDETWRRTFLCEYWREDWLPGIPSIQGVRTDAHKLIRYPQVTGDVDELYDLVSDPLELTNLITDPTSAPIVSDLDEELAAQPSSRAIVLVAKKLGAENADNAACH